MNYLEDCSNRKVIFFIGKGGVGKSSIVLATALAFEKLNKKYQILHWNPIDPHSSLKEEMKLNSTTLHAMTCFKEYALKHIKIEKIYKWLFENKLMKHFLEAAPGFSDSVIASKIWQLSNENPKTTYLVDMPSSGHAVLFFKTLLGIQQLFPKGFISKDLRHTFEFITSSNCRIDLTTLPEELPVTETIETYQKLKALDLQNFGILHLNGMWPLFDLTDEPSKEAKDLYNSQKQKEEGSNEELKKIPLEKRNHLFSIQPTQRQIVEELCREILNG